MIPDETIAKSVHDLIHSVMSESGITRSPRHQILRVGSQILVSIKPDCIASQHIAFRLGEAMERLNQWNSGIQMFMIFPYYQFNVAESMYDLCSWIDPNHSFMKYTIFGRTYTVRFRECLQKSDNVELPHVQQRIVHGRRIERDDDIKNWSAFQGSYRRTYGETPMETLAKIFKDDESWCVKEIKPYAK